MVPSRRDERRRLLVAAALGCLIPLTLPGLALGDVLGAAKAREEAHRAQAERDQPRPPRPLPGKPAYSTYYERLCNEADEHEDADLCQQWRAANGATRGALAAEQQNVLGQLQMRLTLVEIGALCLTLAFTAWAARAASRAAIAAENAIRITEDTAERQLRAYLFPSNASVTHVDIGKPPKVEVVIRNYGQTPAYEMKRWLTCFIADQPTEADFPEPDPEWSIPLTYIGPQDDTRYIEFTPDMDIAAIQGIATGRRSVFAYGRFTYLDAFKKPRTGRFRLFYNGAEGTPADGGMSPCKQGNHYD